MKKLGLDIGTNSVGFALIDTGEKENGLEKIIAIGSRIIKEEDIHKNFNEGKAASKCADRTMYRGARRRYHRYVMRRERLKKILEQNNMMPSKELLLKITEKELYRLRAIAVTEKISLEELGRVLYLLVQKRGFKSNRKDASAKDTDYVEAIKKLNSKMGDKTIGQYFYSVFFDESKKYEITQMKEDFPEYEEEENDTPERIRNNKFFRAKYIEEFDRIWNKQKEFYPKILTDDLQKIVRDDIIYFHRPLKSCKHLIANCEFEKNNKVVSKSSPLHQEAVIWQTINNIEITKNDGTREKPSLESLKKLFDELNFNTKKLLNKQHRLAGSKIMKLLGYKDKECSINYNEGIKGNTTLLRIAEALKKGGVENSEQYLSFNHNNLNEKGNLYHIWHMLFSIQDTEELKKALKNNLSFNDEEIKYLLDISFSSDYGSLSAKAIRKILPHLQKGLMYSDACEEAGYNHSDQDIQIKERLSFIKPNILRNPVVEQVTNQVINIVNNIIDTYGKPDEVIVELARELTKSAKEKQSITKAVNRDRKYHELIRQKLMEDVDYRGKNPTMRDILRYKLWEQTGKKCLYSGKIIPLYDLYNGRTDIEHVIPRSRRLDDSQSNKIISYRIHNEKKGQKTAFEYMETLGEHDVARYVQDIKALNEKGSKCLDGATRKVNGIKLKNLTKTSEDLSKDGSFVASQANDTAYISKKTVELLKEVFGKENVRTAAGGITDKLRDDWGLMKVLQELNEDKYGKENVYNDERIDKETGEIKKYKKLKIGEDKDGRKIIFTKRDDQRHHALDALITALTTHQIVHRLNNAHKDYRTKDPSSKDFKKSNTKFEDLMPRKDLRNYVREALKGILISYNKPKRKVVTISKNKQSNGKTQLTIAPKGMLHKETVFKKIKIKEYSDVSVNKAIETPDKIAGKFEKKQVKSILNMFDGDLKKVRKYIKENPIKKLNDNGEEINATKITIAEEKECFSKRKVLANGLNAAEVKKILDSSIKKIIEDRIKEKGMKAAFLNLDKYPFVNKNGHIIKSVRLQDNGKLTNVNIKKEHPTWVDLRNNHHSIIYKNEETGKLDDRVVSLYEATKTATEHFIQTGEAKEKYIDMNTPIYDEKGNEYKPVMSLQENDLFYFGSELTNKSDFFDDENRKEISKNLYRMQKISKRNFIFRHHLETKVDIDGNRENIKIHIQSLPPLPKVKLHIDNLGKVKNVEIFSF